MRPTMLDVQLPADAGTARVYDEGPADAPVVFMTHSILSSSILWNEQSALLLRRGLRVVRVDARGHGGSRTDSDVATMDDLVADSIAVMDALGLGKVHYVGLSLGGMSGFGLGISHPDRLHSLCISDARADAPPDVAAPWDQRIELARRNGCEALADSTIDRWFGADFVAAHPEQTANLREIAATTQTYGLIACARAIQSLGFLDDASRIDMPVQLIVGERDGVLPQANEALHGLIRGSRLDRIPNAGHLSNIHDPATFNTILLRHLDQAVSIVAE
jgi:3-oxoadipate enol-lactonase